MNKNLIFTVTLTKDHPLYVTCTKTKIEYAKKINADFILITETHYPQIYSTIGFGGGERIAFRDFLHDYDRVLCVDGDVMINPNAPDIFEVYPDSNFGYMHEQGWCDWVSGGWSAHYLSRVPDWRLNPQGFREYYNVGTMLFSKQQQALFDAIDREEFRKDNPPAAEQTYLNYLIQKLKIPMIDVGTTWCKMDYDCRTLQLNNANRLNANFIHYAGGGFSGHERIEKTQVVLKDFATWYPEGLPDYGFPMYLIGE